MVRSGSVWFTTVHRGSLWSGLVQSGSVWFSLVQSGSVRFRPNQSDSVRSDQFLCVPVQSGPVRSIGSGWFDLGKLGEGWGGGRGVWGVRRWLPRGRGAESTNPGAAGQPILVPNIAGMRDQPTLTSPWLLAETTSLICMERSRPSIQWCKEPLYPDLLWRRPGPHTDSTWPRDAACQGWPPLNLCRLIFYFLT